MVSSNDTSILAMLSRYPDIPQDEQDQHIAKIEHQENIPICLAVLSRIPKEDLSPAARITYEEFSRWSSDRTRRMRNEQMTDRQRGRQNRTATRLTELHNKGIIGEQVLFLYGISGDLPDRMAYSQMTFEEKRELWEERMNRRFGNNWRDRIRNVPTMFQERQDLHNWRREGF